MKGFFRGTMHTLLVAFAFLWFVSFSGLRLLAVTSGSMEPALPVGSAVFIFPCPQEEIQAGDVVTFQLGGHLVTHRVVERREEGFVTKGDANEREDAKVVAAREVVGRVAFCLPLLGRLLLLCEGEGKRLVLLYLGFFLLLLLILEGQKWSEQRRKRHVYRQQE